MLTDSKIVTNGTRKRSEPKLWHISTKLRVLFPFRIENGGGLKEGNPAVTLPFQILYVFEIKFNL